jgi:hypothetical protein
VLKEKKSMWKICGRILGADQRGKDGQDPPAQLKVSRGRSVLLVQVGQKIPAGLSGLLLAYLLIGNKERDFFFLLLVVRQRLNE